METKMIALLLLLSLLVLDVQAMAKWMTKEECGKVLRVGETIMGSPAKASDKRTIKVYRNNGDILLKDGAAYKPGEELLVMLYGPKDNGLQFVLEANNAGFVDGGCEGSRRVANVKLGKLRVPSDATAEITIKAGWALGFDNVKISPTFTLIPGGAVEPDKSDAPAVLGVRTEAERRQPQDTPAANELAPAADTAAADPEAALPVEPVKSNLRGGAARLVDTPAAEAPEAKKDEVPQPPPDLPPSVDPPVQDQDSQQANDQQGAGAVAEAAASLKQAPGVGDAEKPAEDLSEGFQKPPLTKQKGAKFSFGDIRAVMQQHKQEQEDQPEPLETLADVDAAIDKMQAMIKDMKKKRADKAKADKAAKQGSDAPIKLNVKTRSKGKGNGIGRDRDREGEGEGREVAEDAEGGEEGELQSATEARGRRSVKRKSQRLTPSGREYLPDGVKLPGKKKATWLSTLQTLTSLVALGLVGLTVIALSVTGVFYCINHGDVVRGWLGRLLRRKQGQDKE